MTRAPGWTQQDSDVAVLLAAAADLESTEESLAGYLLPHRAAFALGQILRWAAGQHTQRPVTKEALLLAELLILEDGE